MTEPPFMKIPGEPSYWHRDSKEDLDKHRAMIAQMERARRLVPKEKPKELDLQPKV